MSGSTAPHPVDACITALHAYLGTAVPDFTIFEEWPYATQQLVYPALTISTIGKIVRTPLMPEQDSVTAPNSANQVTANMITAEYDFSLQLDLWTKNKLDRTQYLNAIIESFQATASPLGIVNANVLNLTLNNYYSIPASFEIQSHECMDDEQAAQRQERREKIVVLVNVREITQQTYYAMTSIQLNAGVGATDETSVEAPQSELEISTFP